MDLAFRFFFLFRVCVFYFPCVCVFFLLRFSLRMQPLSGPYLGNPSFTKVNRNGPYLGRIWDVSGNFWGNAGPTWSAYLGRIWAVSGDFL